MKVGDKVVCINNSRMGPKYVPIVNEIYTFDGVSNHPLVTDFIWLSEFTGLDSIGERVAFRRSCFRPITFGEETCEKIEKELIQEPVTV